MTISLPKTVIWCDSSFGMYLFQLIQIDVIVFIYISRTLVTYIIGDCGIVYIRFISLLIFSNETELAHVCPVMNFEYLLMINHYTFCDIAIRTSAYMYHSTIQVLQNKLCILIRIFNFEWNIRHHAKFWLEFPLSSKWNVFNNKSTSTKIFCL